MSPVLLALALLGVPPKDTEVPRADDPYRAALIAAIHRFAERGDLDHLRALIERHPALVNAREVFRQPRKPLRTDGFTPLHRAIEGDRADVVDFLIEHGADVNADGGGGWTPLHVAARAGNLAVVKRLVKAGAKVDAKTVAIKGYFGVPPSSPPDARPMQIGDIPALTPRELAEQARHAAVVEFLRSAMK